MKDIYNMGSSPFFILAPMDDVTDIVFRGIVGEMAAPDMYFTEFVSVDGLQSSGRGRIIHKLALEKPRSGDRSQRTSRRPLASS
jgi:tRNA-dihydrouridine synthase